MSEGRQRNVLDQWDLGFFEMFFLVMFYFKMSGWTQLSWWVIWSPIYGSFIFVCIVAFIKEWIKAENKIDGISGEEVHR